MESIILQTLVEKVDAQDKAIGELKEQLDGQQEMIHQAMAHVDEVKRECNSLVEGLSFPTTEMQQLAHKIEALGLLLRLPLKKEVSHHHHIHKAMWGVVGLLIIVVVLFILLTQAWSGNKEAEASDFKYRYLKLSPDTGLQRTLFYADSLYFQDADSFRKKVRQEEVQRVEQWRLKQQIEIKEKEVERLKEKAKRKS